jgi:hypothetical protein
VTTGNLVLAVLTLHVEVMETALAFYCAKLGFEKQSEFRAHPGSDNPAHDEHRLP